MSFTDDMNGGIKHIKNVDPLLAALVEHYGRPTFEPHGNYYQELVESIISQQLSVKAAAAITKRFIELFGHFPEPQEIIDRDIEELRAVGLSRPKARYIQDLAAHVIDGGVRFNHLDTLGDDAIIAELSAVKGIGVWTAHMFLIFCMGRLDVLAYGDLGVRTAIKNVYSLETLPDQITIEELAIQRGWHPYASIACWYLWKSLENKHEEV